MEENSWFNGFQMNTANAISQDLKDEDDDFGDFMESHTEQDNSEPGKKTTDEKQEEIEKIVDEAKQKDLISCENSDPSGNDMEKKPKDIDENILEPQKVEYKNDTKITSNILTGDKHKASEKETLNKIAETTEDSTTQEIGCLLYTSPSPRDLSTSRMPSSA
eukprot:TRINITY_DN29452_c0_g1_i1.p3 TRINITY_DN29452_c0_g1~~TRINITY_DN29452_c0_g1_i1.p3  ORF type:complete len:162 (+),score=48.95 TRINITY_DN29452_c0_g1_i1:178-663(+)